jgi:hypothetical protein
LAERGVNGPVVAFLFGFVPTGETVNGTLAVGTLTGADLIPRPLIGFGGTMGELIARMRAGGAYVNVHTIEYPGGEIRGQIRPAGPAADAVFALADHSIVGDANLDGRFDRSDIKQVLHANKYSTGQQATRGEGDWNGDGVFDSADLVLVFQSADSRGQLQNGRAERKDVAFADVDEDDWKVGLDD